METRIFLVLSITVLGVFFFVSTPYAHSEDPVGVVIHITDSGFEPNEISVSVGDTVIFENIGGNDHWPASNIHPTHRGYPGSDIKLCDTEKEPEIFDSCQGLKPGESFGFTFNHIGGWRFHDHIDPRLKGKITVENDGEAVSENNNERDIANRGFIDKAWALIKNFLSGIFSGFFPAENKFDSLSGDFRREMEELDKNYDPSINKDSEEIFNNKEALFSYVKKYGPAETTKRLYSLESQFGFCHNSSHDAGRFAYGLTGGEAFQKCSAECHSGCYHGATEAFFRDRGIANFVEDLNLLCNEELNPFFSHQCIHGIGHGLMAWADYDIHEALASCDLLPNARESCYSGVFMENIVGGLAPEQGHFTEYLNDDPLFPCTMVEEKYANACYFYQTSRMVQLFGGDFSKVAGACSEIDPIYQISCFGSMGRDVGGANRKNPAGAIKACSLVLPGQSRIACLSGAVQDSFWISDGQDDAIRFCRMLSNREEKYSCYSTIITRASNVISSIEDFKIFCGKTEEEYQSLCFTTKYNLN